MSAPGKLERSAWLLLLGVTCLALTAGSSAAPNFVIFITDDQSRHDSSPYGAHDLRTPNMQRLADAGLTFDYAFVASPSCAPSRAALLTGLMPARNGAEPNHSRPRPEIKKLPAYLHDLGYEVAAFGKVAHYGQADLYGFDHAAAGKWMDKNNISAATEFLESWRREKPLCLFVGTHEPHVPWPANDDYDPDRLELPPTHVDTPETRQFRAKYATAVTDADRKLGVIYDLARQKLGTNTVFFFTSDHGAQWPFSKWNLYDEGIRVPLIAVWPGVIAPKTRTDAMVSWIDILPTLVALAGGSPPSDIDGRSFAPILRGQAPELRDRIFTTHSGDGKFNVFPMRSLRTRDWKFILNLHPEFEYHTHIDLANAVDGTLYWSSWERAAQTNGDASATVQRYYQRPSEELYDLRKDPQEQHNLALDPGQSERVKAVRAELEAWMKQQGDQRRVYNTPVLRQTGP